MPRTKRDTGATTPANKQEKKICPVCKKEKAVSSGFYKSASPLFSNDGSVPICISCVKKDIVNDDGTINLKRFKVIMQRLDKPLYWSSLESAYNQYRKEHGFLSDDEIAKQGKEIVALYFKNINSLPQNKNKSFADSEKDNFISQNSNISKAEYDRINRKYNKVNGSSTEKIAFTNIVEKSSVSTEDEHIKWTKKDKQNMKYVISAIGYDPYEDVELSASDRKYCFNILAGYFDTDGIIEDGHKMQGVIEIAMLYCQCKKITEAMNAELKKPEADDTKISKLTSSKSSLLSSIATIAKDNNIASNYNKNSKQGQNSLSSKMKEMAENGFQEIAVNLFDIKTAEAFKQIDEISLTNIANQLTLDNSEYADIVKEQLEMIHNYEDELEILKEENRNLKNKIIDLENKKR